MQCNGFKYVFPDESACHRLITRSSLQSSPERIPPLVENNTIWQQKSSLHPLDIAWLLLPVFCPFFVADDPIHVPSPTTITRRPEAKDLNRLSLVDVLASHRSVRISRFASDLDKQCASSQWSNDRSKTRVAHCTAVLMRCLHEPLSFQ